MEINIEHNIFTSVGHKVLKINQQIKEGSFVRVFGDSGIGKTTFFRIIAGLITPDSGYIRTEDRVLLDISNGIFLPPQERNVAIMFQNYALFPNMTIKQNIMFAQKGKDALIVEELLERFDLKMLEHTLPSRLSGGQQQRVSLARTLVQQAHIVLLDEPLSAVDVTMKKVMVDEISKSHRTQNATFFVISHNESDFHDIEDCTLIIE